MKIFLKLIPVLMVLAATLSLTACPEIDGAHNHVYSKDWSYDEQNHWRDPMCEHEYLLKPVNQGAHTWDEGSVTIEATEYSEGEFAYTCTVCGTKRVAYTIPALPHVHTYNEEWEFNDYYHWHTASCGHQDVTGPKENHGYLGNTCLLCGFMKESTGLIFEERADGTYAVIGRDSTCLDKNLVIPELHEGKKVTEISSNAFAGYGILTQLILPPTIRSIGDYAFSNCQNLEAVVYTDTSSLKSIGSYAFQNCYKLGEITIPASVTYIGVSPFYYCNVLAAINVEEACGNYKSVDGVLYSKDGTELLQYPIGKTDTQFTISKDVTTLGAHVFTSCDFLEEIIFEEGSQITSIPTEAFCWLNNLKTIEIPETVTELGRSALADCHSIQELILPPNITYIADSLLFNCFSLKEIVIPAGVTAIGNQAFEKCESITEITFPAGVKSIGEKALSGCNNLVTVNIPASVTTIKGSVLYGSKAIQNINVDEGNTSYRSINGDLYNKSAKTLICYSIGKPDADFEVPSTVTKIEANAFYLSSNLVNVTLPEGLRTIGTYAFFFCRNLESVNLPSSLTSIGKSAFESCASLKEITIPQKITSISERAFYDCDSLTTVTIGETITKIEKEAFAVCDKLKNVIFVDTDGWWVSEDKNATEGRELSAEDLSNAETAAAFITQSSYYIGFYWKKA